MRGSVHTTGREGEAVSTQPSTPNYPSYKQQFNWFLAQVDLDRFFSDQAEDDADAVTVIADDDFSQRLMWGFQSQFLQCMLAHADQYPVFKGHIEGFVWLHEQRNKIAKWVLADVAECDETLNLDELAAKTEEELGRIYEGKGLENLFRAFDQFEAYFQEKFVEPLALLHGQKDEIDVDRLYALLQFVPVDTLIDAKLVGFDYFAELQKHADHVSYMQAMRQYTANPVKIRPGVANFINAENSGEIADYFVAEKRYRYEQARDLFLTVVFYCLFPVTAWMVLPKFGQKMQARKAAFEERWGATDAAYKALSNESKVQVYDLVQEQKELKEDWANLGQWAKESGRDSYRPGEYTAAVKAKADQVASSDVALTAASMAVNNHQRRPSSAQVPSLSKLSCSTSTLITGRGRARSQSCPNLQRFVAA